MSAPFKTTILPANFEASTVFTTLSSIDAISSPNSLRNSPSCGVKIVCGYVSTNNSLGFFSKQVIASASITTCFTNAKANNVLDLVSSLIPFPGPTKILDTFLSLNIC